jgi:ubiquinone biosynthesis protein COQ9
MSEDISIKDKVIASALKNINFDGWSKKSILSGFEECNIDKSRYIDLFPNGTLDAILHFASYADRLMLEKYQKTKLDLERVPEKIKFLLLARCCEKIFSSSFITTKCKICYKISL